MPSLFGGSDRPAPATRASIAALLARKLSLPHPRTRRAWHCHNPRMLPPLPPQLDLFAHSADTMLRNDVLGALLRHDAAAAGAALQALRGLAPDHPALAALDTLTEALRRDGAPALPLPPAPALLAWQQLEQRVGPAALAQLGAADASAWMAPLWRALALRAAALPFRPEHAEVHAAPLCLRAADWQAAEAAVLGIASWRRIPAPLGWMAEARSRRLGLDAAWPLLVELAWLAGPRLGAVAKALGDPLLTRLLRRFDDQFDPGAHPNIPALAWWPAWLLVDQAALLPHLRQAEAGQDSLPERSFRLLAELLGLERQGRHAELMAARKRLRDLQPALFEAYMRSR